MTLVELRNLKPGHKVKLVRGATFYDHHFRIGDVLTVRSIDDFDRFYVEQCTKRLSPSCLSSAGCSGTFSIIENFEVVQPFTDKELEAATKFEKPQNLDEMNEFFK